jgi:acetyl-CoA carboxylase biotin carboxylase subunit
VTPTCKPSSSPINRVLIANRGEIALRIIRACQALGIETVLAVSQEDRESLPARHADFTVCIGPADPVRSYLDHRLIVAAAQGTNADAVHPGYGFLAESVNLAQSCLDNGIRFVGPKPDQIGRMGDKLEARALACKCGIPVLSGSEHVRTHGDAEKIAREIGYPVLIKAASGGGGRGTKVVAAESEMEPAFRIASREAQAAFGDDTLYLERFLADARHVEVQVVGDQYGNIVHFGERDCSLQRRRQKLVEEAPGPMLTGELRRRIQEAAIKFARSFNYENAGTVEFILDRATGDFYFLEMNARIQVEHGVSELISGVDLVQEQFRMARGERLRFAQEDIVLRGHALECRINAEVPSDNFRPSPGRITQWNPPEGPHIRLDTHCYAGYRVPMFYDSLLAKLIVYGIDRSEALERMRAALRRFAVVGIETTIPFLRRLMDHSDVVAGTMNTRLVDELLHEARLTTALSSRRERV